MKPGPSLSNETLGCLRNCDLMNTGTLGGITFVRCIPFVPGVRGLSSADARMQAGRVVAEIDDPGAVVAAHETFGWYVRVDVASPVFKLICHMKS